MILVDSSVWIDYFNGVDNPYTAKLDSLLDVELIAIGDIRCETGVVVPRSDRAGRFHGALFA